MSLENLNVFGFQKKYFSCTFKKAPKCFIHPNSLEFLGKIYPVALIDWV